MPARRFVNTSPLVFLVREDLLELLRVGVDDVAIPWPVIEEIRGHGMDDPTVRALDRADWLTIVPGPAIPPAIAAWRLGPGESAVLALALAEVGSWAVIDDWGARRCAARCQPDGFLRLAECFSWPSVGHAASGETAARPGASRSRKNTLRAGLSYARLGIL